MMHMSSAIQLYGKVGVGGPAGQRPVCRTPHSRLAVPFRGERKPMPVRAGIPQHTCMQSLLQSMVSIPAGLACAPCGDRPATGPAGQRHWPECTAYLCSKEKGKKQELQEGHAVPD